MSNDWGYNYPLLEKRLRDAIATMRSTLNERDVHAAEEYLDHDEYGLAFDILRDAIVDGSILIPKKAYDVLEAAARQMKYLPEATDALTRLIQVDPNGT